MKLKELPYLLGLQPRLKTYGFKVKSFDLPKDGKIEYAQWLHPKDRGRKSRRPRSMRCANFSRPEMWQSISERTRAIRRFRSRSPWEKRGCVLALEPNRYVFPVLKKNSELNAEKTNIIPLMFAATPEDAEMEFRVLRFRVIATAGDSRE